MLSAPPSLQTLGRINLYGIQKRSIGGNWPLAQYVLSVWSTHIPENACHIKPNYKRKMTKLFNMQRETTDHHWGCLDVTPKKLTKYQTGASCFTMRKIHHWAHLLRNKNCGWIWIRTAFRSSLCCISWPPSFLLTFPFPDFPRPRIWELISLI